MIVANYYFLVLQLQEVEFVSSFHHQQYHRFVAVAFFAGPADSVETSFPLWCLGSHVAAIEDRVRRSASEYSRQSVDHFSVLIYRFASQRNTPAQQIPEQEVADALGMVPTAFSGMLVEYGLTLELTLAEEYLLAY